jgi:hypothetical protein
MFFVTQDIVKICTLNCFQYFSYLYLIYDKGM